MAVVGVEITAREPLPGAEEVGATAPYEVVRGVTRFAVDPSTRASRRIVDLELAPRDADGRVHFEADFQVVRPVDPARGSGGLLYMVANRGGTQELPLARRGRPTLEEFNAAMRVPAPPLRATDGFLLRRGWSIMWSGWQWDVLRAGAAVGLSAPEIVPSPDDRVCVSFRARTTRPDHALNDDLVPYVIETLPSASWPAVLDDATAVLTVREYEHGPGEVIPRPRWAFARDERGTAVPDPCSIRLEGGFEEGRVYEVRYRTAKAPVVGGTGLLAARDAVSWVRHAPDSPLAGRVQRTLAFGSSQSGRFLRQLLFDGLNVDEEGRTVFDGMLIHMGGSRRGSFNQRYGQPGAAWAVANHPPFDTAGLLDCQRPHGGVPKVVITNTAFEYWRGDAARTHLDAEAGVDLVDPPEARHYLIAGTDHVGTTPMGRLMPVQHPPGETNSSFVPHAAFEVLDQWVAEGIEPPESRVPRLDDGTAVTRSTVLDHFAARGHAIPDLEGLHQPDAWPVFVSAVGADGNEVAGVRIPEVAVPVAAYTGWNVFRPVPGRVAAAPEFVGSAVPFVSDEELAARYRDRRAVESEVEVAARALVAQRWLLPEDLDFAVAEALRRYDAAVGR